MIKRNTRCGDEPTKAEKFLAVTADGHWHSTKELAHRVGHTFGGAIFRLRHRYHYDIDRQKHPREKYQHQYRLLDQSAIGLPTRSRRG